MNVSMSDDNEYEDDKTYLAYCTIPCNHALASSISPVIHDLHVIYIYLQ